MPSWVMFTAGILLMTIILVRRSMRYYRKRASRSDLSPSSGRLDLTTARRTLMDAPKEVLRWQVEMHEMARDVNAELDTKMRSLQVLIRMADEATERLQQAILKKE